MRLSIGASNGLFMRDTKQVVLAQVMFGLPKLGHIIFNTLLNQCEGGFLSYDKFHGVLTEFDCKNHPSFEG